VAHPKAMALPTEVLLQLNTLALAHRKASVFLASETRELSFFRNSPAERVGSERSRRSVAQGWGPGTH